MKVEASNNNYRLTSYAATRQVQPSFKRGKPLGDRITDALPAKGIIKWMKSLEWLKGETGGILITAIGTGVFAPFSIALNPFMRAPKNATKEQKEDVKNTKIYTAFRQPISAVLAIIFQVLALKPIDKFLDSIFNNPNYSKHVGLHVDQSAINSKSYVETLVKKEFKKDGKKIPSWMNIFKDGYKKVKEDRKVFKDNMKSRVSVLENEQIDKLAKTFQETGTIKIGSRTLDNPTIAELLNSQIGKYIKDAEALKIDEKGMKFYSERAEILMNNENYLKQIFENVPENSKELKTYLENLSSKETNKDVKMLIDEILQKPENYQGSRVRRTLARIEKIRSMCDGNYSKEKYIEQMQIRNKELDNVIDRLSKNEIKEIKSATKESIAESIKKIADCCKFEKGSLLDNILHDTDTFGDDAAKLTKKLHKDVTKLYKDMVRNKYRAPNQLFKIAVGVFITLPITCNTLNWIYPRFMEKFFPKVSGVKKEKEEGNK